MTGSSSDEANAARVSVAEPELSQLADEELLRRAREDTSKRCALDALFRRYYPVVARWSLRFCRDPDEAADLAQEVFLRVHSRIGTFRMECRFSTWLYKIARNIAINRAAAARRIPWLEGDSLAEIADSKPDAEEITERQELLAELSKSFERDLDRLEARVMYLHFIDGLTLDAITELLKLENKSGARAYIVSSKRKLKRRFIRRHMRPVNVPEAI